MVTQLVQVIVVESQKLCMNEDHLWLRQQMAPSTVPVPLWAALLQALAMDSLCDLQLVSSMELGSVEPHCDWHDLYLQGKRDRDIACTEHDVSL